MNKGELWAARLARYNEDVTRLAVNLRTGRVTLGMWQEEMKLLIRQLHTGAAVIGKGASWSDMTHRDWGRLGPVLKEQYKYLAGFAQDIYDNASTITAERIAWRSKLYGIKAAYSIGLTEAGDIGKMLPYLPKDGSTECLINCKCHWAVTAAPPVDGMIPVRAVWTLNPAEHCPTCQKRTGYTENLIVPEGTPIPAQIGGYD